MKSKRLERRFRGGRASVLRDENAALEKGGIVNEKKNHHEIHKKMIRGPARTVQK